MENDLCKICRYKSFDTCEADFSEVDLDDLTRFVVSCDCFIAIPKKKLKITYECGDKIAVVKKEVYNLPDLDWKTVDYEPEFEAIWKLYPRKLDKKAALKAYKCARKNGASIETIEQGIHNYISEINRKNTPKEFIKRFATWLNGACWENEPEEDEQTSSNPFLNLAREEGLYR